MNTTPKPIQRIFGVMVMAIDAPAVFNTLGNMFIVYSFCDVIKER